MTLFTLKPMLWALLLIPMLVCFRYSLVNRPKAKRWLSFILRTNALILLIVTLCQPFLNKNSDKKHTVFLLDVSHSIDVDNIQKVAMQTAEQIKSLPSGDSYSLFLFAESLVPVKLDKLNEEVKKYTDPVTGSKVRRKTDLGGAMKAARLFYPADKLKVMNIITDGMDTEKQLASALDQLKQENIELCFTPAKSVSWPEASVVSLKASSSYAFRGETLRLTAELLANQPMKGKLRFLNKGIVITEKQVELKGNKITSVGHEFSVSPDSGDIWEAELIPEKDHFPVNNIARAPVKVLGEARVLALAEKPSKLRDFSRALKSQGIHVDVRTHHGIPETLHEFNTFNAVIFADMPAEKISTHQMDLIKLYVKECGGGLIMTGSENSFGLGGYYKTPVEEVLPVSSRYEKEKEHPSLALALVIDKSGSMSGNPIELAKAAAIASAELLSPRDQIAVIAFDGQPRTVCEMTSALNKGDVIDSIGSIGAGGGTNLFPAMDLAKEMLVSTASPLKHMIILSDGQSSGGDFEGCAAEMADMGGTVSTVSLGQGAAVDLMKSIAEIGRGRAYVTNNAEEVPRIFTRDTMEASKSAIKEEPFQPVKAKESLLLEGLDIESSPFLLGYVMTRLKAATEPILLAETGDPLLVSGRYGLGTSLAFTSDITDKWAGEWLEWDGFGRFWSQIIRGVINDTNDKNVQVKLAGHNGVFNIDMACRTLAGTPGNGMKWKGKIIDKYGKTSEISFEPTGHGKYTSKFIRNAEESFTLQLHDEVTGAMKTIHHTVSYPSEYQLAAEISPKLQKLPKLSADLFKDKQVEVHQSALDLIALLSILMLMGSVLFRRI